MEGKKGRGGGGKGGRVGENQKEIETKTYRPSVPVAHVGPVLP